MSDTALLLTIVLLGIASVIGTILFLRLHAFLALVLGALVVGLLTPLSALEGYFIETAGVKVAEVTDEGLVIDASPKLVLKGTPFLVLAKPAGKNSYEQKGQLSADEGDEDVGTVRLAFGGEFERDDYHEGDVVITPTAYSAARKSARVNLGTRLASAFGSTAGKIGILIALASVIGKCLLDSGAADRIVRTLLGWFGEAGAPFAFIFSGFLLAIPVFFDTVFYLMIPLGKAMGLRTGRNYLLYVLTIVAGGTMAHSLVPPTPGPLFVAEELGVNLGTMILAGCGVGLASSLTGFLWARYINGKRELPLRDTPDMSLEDLKQISDRPDSELPSFWLSLQPILLPVIFIGGFTILKQENDQGVSLLDRFPAWLQDTLTLLGDKNIAIGIGAVIGIYLLVRQSHPTRDEFASSVQSSLASAGIIILITSAGGAFGQMLKETGVASLIQDLPFDAPLLVLVLAFLVTTAVRTAQGSSTVAMITTVGLFGPIAAGGELGLHPVYLALAIGCGSKPIAWMNDSGFWVITRMSGMTEKEGLQYITPMSIFMGIVGLIATLIAAAVFPGV